ncbi:hypothetical protein [Natrinema sp. CGMCC1.2065]
MEENTEAETRHCHHCGTEREVQITVPWQDDLCTHCGRAVDDQG